MRKFWMILFACFIMVGCGERGKQEFQGATQSKDFIQEGQKYLANGDLKNAIDSFDNAIKANPSDPNNYITLAQVYMRGKAFNRAVDTLNAAIHVAPENGDAHYLIAMNYAFSGKTEEAKHHAEKSVDIFMKTRQEDKFKQAVAMLKGLTQTEQTEAAADGAMESAKEMVPVVQ